MNEYMLLVPSIAQSTKPSIGFIKFYSKTSKLLLWHREENTVSRQ